MSYYNEMNESHKESITNTLIRNVDDLRSIYIGSAERLVKALILISSGGSITILAYIKNVSSHCILSCSLVFFLLGLMLVFMVIIYDFIITNKNHNKLRAEIYQFYSNKISSEKISIFDVEKYKPSVFLYMTGILSIACSALGVIFGLVGYFAFLQS